ncbi:2-dehydropantoate 2-reductase [Pseudoclavibacter endophyticus]|uniref:2-dehydropantoate 2-reductase n=1 Tax=Pseudoclavibacter endophyticus TaxID=1778590 RepID=A0A6H9WMN2_9MICO|nr:2-dehydropantoate 2-reductase [Pseudoclavibacter endophyticus]KAB1647806.1 2-dehydropantoate 2-reductase [Pseudoclavibacter endophyticus]GGA72981.1 2-dehydropantoate 2-reductase [Pseudoclavibacter endophyticus]
MTKKKTADRNPAAALPQHIAVIGAGAMGTLFAARIAEQGIGVTLVDIDRRRLDAIAGHGIALTDDAGTRTVAVGTASADQLGPGVQLAIVFTKSMHTRAAAASIAHLAACGTTVLTLQNGLGNAESIATAFPPTQILKGMAALPADLAGVTEVRTHGSAHVVLGPFQASPVSDDAAASAVALLSGAGFDAELATTADVDVAVWEKVAFNAALNTIAAVTGRTNGGMDNEPGRAIAAAIVDEVAATAMATGIAVDAPRIHVTVIDALVQHRHHEPSMLQDVAAGRPTEIEAIAGAVIERAEAVGVDVPVTRTLANLVRLVETPRT